MMAREDLVRATVRGEERRLQRERLARVEVRRADLDAEQRRRVVPDAGEAGAERGPRALRGGLHVDAELGDARAGLRDAERAHVADLAEQLVERGRGRAR